MLTPLFRLCFALATIATSLALSAAASAQLIPLPAKPAATPSPRAAACHNGASFESFLSQLKQQAGAAGVSSHALAEAQPYLVYDQSIVNRDRGQRVFGQVFSEFAGRMAANYRMQQGQARIKTYAVAFCARGEGVRRAAGGDRG